MAGARKRTGWRIALVWAMAVLFALAPLEAQAVVAGGTQHEHTHHHGKSAAPHTHDIDHHIHFGADLDHGAGHQHSTGDQDGCCGTFCHTAIAHLALIGLTVAAAPVIKVRSQTKNLHGQHPRPSLPPPKSFLI